MMKGLLTIRETCRLCGSKRIVCCIPLASVPIVSPNVGTELDAGGARLTTIIAPLDSYLCENCGLIQLIHIVDPGLIYRNYLYRSAISLGLAEHFRGLSKAIIDGAGLKPSDLAVEFGSNDGTLLSFLRDAGMRVQGVDPAQTIAAEATAKGIPTRADFFNCEVARDILGEQGGARAVIANNALANIDDLDSILHGVKAMMVPDGVFVFETQYALDVFEKTLLDVIYHEHISMFSVQPVVHGLERFNLEVFDVERIPTKGGSVRFWAQHTNGPRPVGARVAELINLEQRTGLYDLAYHRRFSARIAHIREGLHALISEARAGGRQIGAYGTSVGCAALVHQFELEDKIDFLFDDTPFKTRLDGPGYDLPVYAASGVSKQNPALIIILAWRYADQIKQKHAGFIKQGGRFVVPLPEISITP